MSDSLCVFTFMDHTPLFLPLHNALLSLLVFHTSTQCFPHLPSPLGFVRAGRRWQHSSLCRGCRQCCAAGFQHANVSSAALCAPLKSSSNLGAGWGKFCITRFCRRAWKLLPALPMGLSLGSVRSQALSCAGKGCVLLQVAWLQQMLLRWRGKIVNSANAKVAQGIKNSQRLLWNTASQRSILMSCSRAGWGSREALPQHCVRKQSHAQATPVVCAFVVLNFQLKNCSRVFFLFFFLFRNSVTTCSGLLWKSKLKTEMLLSVFRERYKD